MILTSPRLGAPRPFWQPYRSARSVVVVEVNGYTIGPGANLEGADLDGADLDGANLEGANLEGVDLGGFLQGSNLSRANLRGANLRAMMVGDLDIAGGIIPMANLDGARADSNTIWPDWPKGFDPVAAGVIFD